jgi:hypothetical protein
MCLDKTYSTIPVGNNLYSKCFELTGHLSPSLINLELKHMKAKQENLKELKQNIIHQLLYNPDDADLLR